MYREVAYNYAVAQGTAEGPYVAPETEAPTEVPTEAPTEAPTNAATEEATEAAKGGCGSVIGFSVVALLAAAAAFVCSKHD